MKRIYLDHAATTPPDERVLEAMAPFLRRVTGNPSSLHAAGREARRAVEDARERIAALLAVDPPEIVFTSGATESNNWALSEAGLPDPARRHVIVSAIEHPSILEPARALAARGFPLTVLPVGPDGIIDPERLRSAIRPDTGLVAIQWVNSEIGAIQPVREIAEICSGHGALHHCDATQAVGRIPVRLEGLPIGSLAASGHKFNGPKGVGISFLRRGLRRQPLLRGGAQERDRRAGTENVPAIVGFARALEIAVEEGESRRRTVESLRIRLDQGIAGLGLRARLAGVPPASVPHTCVATFPGLGGQSLLMNLDLRGIAVSLGSACSSGAAEPSHVLAAIGLSLEDNLASIRISLGHTNTPEDIDGLVASICQIAS